MLPIAAALVMGALSRQASSSRSAGSNANALSPSSGTDIVSMLNATLGQQGGGGIAGSVAGLLGKFLGR